MATRNHCGELLRRESEYWIDPVDLLKIIFFFSQTLKTGVMGNNDGGNLILVLTVFSSETDVTVLDREFR